MASDIRSSWVQPSAAARIGEVHDERQDPPLPFRTAIELVALDGRRVAVERHRVCAGVGRDAAEHAGVCAEVPDG